MPDISTKKGITSVRGRITLAEAHEMKAELLALLKGPGDILLDLSEVEEIDTAGFQLLILLRNEALKSGEKAVRVTEHSQATGEITKLYMAHALWQ